MSYKGERDMFSDIVVPQMNCMEYQTQNGATLVEVFIPPENAVNYKDRWGSIMVKPEQVAFVADVPGQTMPLNCIYCNDNTRIVNSVKDDRRAILFSETLRPRMIVGRYLKWYEISKAMRERTRFTEYQSYIYYEFWKRSRMSQLNWIEPFVT